ncbi:P-loop containing nucleoside triphosphate hydrolase protein [Biscogniauxia sp. FL1348]|nr:P-loop containing nucleoside triphosphate hydrolase protein [Biscogniauxia sp. FL1348]
MLERVSMMIFQPSRRHIALSFNQVHASTRLFISSISRPTYPSVTSSQNDWDYQKTTRRYASFRSGERRALLSIVEKLVSQGIKRPLIPPQIIVCGDRSSGKSSVLEAISGIPFPTDDRLCTRFATKLVLCCSFIPRVSVRISPGPGRSAEDKKRLASFQCIDTRVDIGQVIENAKAVMGINDEDRPFSTDILHVEISGPEQPDLSMVDLPGFFLADSHDCKENDATLVKSLVLSYMQDPRNIILAVISAHSDFALQQVMGHARVLDPKGARTLGLITKPDLLSIGSERNAFFKLAQNRHVQFSLGWHVLRNPYASEHKLTISERDKTESKFFSGCPWTSLDPSQLGARALRIRLGNMLWDQMMGRVPGALEDVETEILECQNRLAKLGVQRCTVPDQRKYLLAASIAFSGLMKSALDGIYTDSFFGSAEKSEPHTRRLRAVMRNSLSEFSDQMRRYGHAKIIQEYVDIKETDPRYVSKSAYISEMKTVVKQSRGQELISWHNPLVVTELLRRQCKPWQRLVRDLTLQIFASVHTTTSSIIRHVMDEKSAERVLWEFINPSLEDLKRGLTAAAEELLEPHVSGHPITYSHGLDVYVQKAGGLRQRRRLEEILKRAHGHRHNASLLRSEWPLDSHPYGHRVNNDQTARNKFVDDISVLAIERCVAQRLPRLFPPETVWNLADTEIQQIAAESDASARTRKRVTGKLQVLEDGRAELKKQTGRVWR